MGTEKITNYSGKTSRNAGVFGIYLYIQDENFLYQSVITITHLQSKEYKQLLCFNPHATDIAVIHRIPLFYLKTNTTSSHQYI